MINRIKYLRLIANVTQEELAQRIGTSVNMLGKLERGQRDLNARWIEKIASALQCEYADLFVPASFVPIIGTIEDDGMVIDRLDEWDNSPVPEVKKPPFVSEEAAALIVRGNALQPLAEDGWIVVFSSYPAESEEEISGKICVVRTDAYRDCDPMIRRVLKGSVPGKYHLVWSGAFFLEDVTLRQVRRVVAIIPR